MKKYIEYKHEMSVVDDKRAWINPTPTGKEPVMDEAQAAIINDQFPNSGIKLELAEVKEETAVETIDHVVTEEDLVNNPDLAEQGVNVGDTIQIPAPSTEE